MKRKDAYACENYIDCANIVTGENYVRIDDEYFCCDCATSILRYDAIEQDMILVLEARNVSTIITVLQQVNSEALASALKLVVHVD